MKTFWIIVSAIGGVTAVFFVIRNDYDSAFIAATLGAVAWFLSYRVQLTADHTDETDVDVEES